MIAATASSLKKISFPVPPPTLGDLADRLLGEHHAAHEGDPLLPHHQPHRTDLPGQAICRGARERGIESIVDGAHAFAQFPFKHADLDCDDYGTSLHKWLLAPLGTGFLYVRSKIVEDLAADGRAAEKMTDNIRKFEEIGTHPAANHNAIAEALNFHQASASSARRHGSAS